MDLRDSLHEVQLRVQVAQALLVDALDERPGPDRRTILEALMEVDAAERILAFSVEPANDTAEAEEVEAPGLRLVQSAD
ncbi:hypothetical protein [Roseomonas sp. KE0001]|uniref:hypothetical protein n=1 Tax=unclassified Roseomonas TaxID=2617492 RepID=UPI0018DF097E|nr:hypothetical protein [Roseomonas sp. KE0001]MBI0433866.1 hypothetical protein [Roseomonas sp. KE0001]